MKTNLVSFRAFKAARRHRLACNNELGADMTPLEQSFDGREDELSLIDLAHVLVRRRWAMAVAFLAVLLLGGLAALLMPTSYEYGAVLRIGQVDPGLSGQLRRQQSVEELRADVQVTTLPAVMRELAEEAPEASVPNNVEVDAGGNSKEGTASRYVTLRTRAQADNPYAVKLLERVAEDVITRHQAELDLALAQQRNRLAVAENELAQLTDERLVKAADNLLLQKLTTARQGLDELERDEARTRAQLKALGQRRELLSDRQAELRESIVAIEATARDAQAEVGQANEAMTLFMLRSDLEEMRRRLQSFEDAALIELPQQEQELTRRLDALTQEKAAQRQRIQQVEEELMAQQVRREAEVAAKEASIATTRLRMDAQQPTRLQLAPRQGLVPVGGAGLSLKLILVGFLAAMVSLVTAFVVEFLANVRRHGEQSAQQGTPGGELSLM